jgi:hypothetical protein
MSRSAWVAVAALAIAGCAELASVVPAVSIGGTATRRVTERSSGATGEEWSWGGTVQLSASGALPPPATEEPPLLRPIAPMAGAPCRVPEACLWEERARTMALARARAIAEARR